MNVRVVCTYVCTYIRLACCRCHRQSGCLMPVYPQCFTCTAIRLPLVHLPLVLATYFMSLRGWATCRFLDSTVSGSATHAVTLSQAMGWTSTAQPLQYFRLIPYDAAGTWQWPNYCSYLSMKVHTIANNLKPLLTWVIWSKMLTLQWSHKLHPDLQLWSLV